MTGPITVGYQHAFNANRNGFLYNAWPNLPEDTPYFESAQLKRGDDLILRIHYSFEKK